MQNQIQKCICIKVQDAERCFSVEAKQEFGAINNNKDIDDEIVSCRHTDNKYQAMRCEGGKKSC